MRVFLFTALLCLVAINGTFAQSIGAFTCDPRSVAIIDRAPVTRLVVKCRNAIPDGSDSINESAFPLDTQENIGKAQSFMHLAALASVNQKSIFMEFVRGRDSTVCGSPNTCRRMMTITLND